MYVRGKTMEIINRGINGEAGKAGYWTTNKNTIKNEIWRFELIQRSVQFQSWNPTWKVTYSNRSEINYPIDYEILFVISNFLSPLRLIFMTPGIYHFFLHRHHDLEPDRWRRKSHGRKIQGGRHCRRLLVEEVRSQLSAFVSIDIYDSSDSSPFSPFLLSRTSGRERQALFLHKIWVYCTYIFCYHQAGSLKLPNMFLLEVS